MKKRVAVLTASMAILLAACGQQESPEPSTPATDTASSPASPVSDAGQGVYNRTCAMCHASGAAGAPIPGDTDDWAPRIAQGVDVLYTHSIEGYSGDKGFMPAKGGNPSLSDEEVKSAVDFMVERSR